MPVLNSGETVAGKIFINYRRGDDPGFAQALLAHLTQVFPPEQLFMDVDNIEPGLDFVRVLNDQVAQCDILISVVGKNWTDARDENGARCLDNPEDFVRIEIEAALQQDKRVIPVLVGQAQMPRTDQLPDTLRPFARRNAVRLTHERFRSDTGALIAALQRALKNVEDARKTEADAARLAAQTKEHRDEEARQRAVEAKAREGAEDEQRRREAETGSQAAKARRVRSEVEAQLRAETEQRRLTAVPEPRPRWQRGPVIGSLIGAAIIGGIGVWLAIGRPQPVPSPAPPSAVAAPPPPVAPAPTPAAPTQSTNRPLSPQQERALKPGDTFQECSVCPQMVVVPAGSFAMGSPAGQGTIGEHPQHDVTIGNPFTAAKFELTFAEWDACVADDACNGHRPKDRGWGRGRQPVIDVSWDDANAYVAWLAKKSGKSYRLLSEAEYEYATRARTTTEYPWGDKIGNNNANCNGCGSRWDKKQTAPVGSFAANGFGLYDMVGNIWEWTQDCYHDGYYGAPTDGSAWTTGVCSVGVVRGGFWGNDPGFLRSASRIGITAGFGDSGLGFRVGRTLLAP